MAGMLPGVEYARRRRRFHGSGRWSDSPGTAGFGSTRRSSFCLYSSNHESYLSSSSCSSLVLTMFIFTMCTSNQAYQDERLGGIAREAKERLDERLRAPLKSETKRINSQEKLRVMEDRPMVLGDLHTEVFGSKKSGSKRFNWAKLGWKASDQVECAVCLDQFRDGESLVHMPCAHRFHSKCLVPWLENNAHCPCCRMGILSRKDSFS
ncbi:hypothetical protein RJ639_041153 [Escallonia herrerae]|uniref:RING-type domain-containing protein n=1 Tax=Escallonia herrerae TaxID=1293975 RepID=A0AA89B6P9_9ASTE|nr:hypothetical protein RJ639_041153 [Escallonia herrerae]